MNHHVGYTSIFSIFDRADFEREVESGYVTVRQHPSLPLNIANYTPQAQYERRWNNVTEWCRGLIFDNDFNIVARSWRKFHNLGQVNLPIQMTDPVEVMDKADGSLGILYPAFHPEGLDVAWSIATRGSFESEQAIHATKVWREKYSHIDPIPGFTMLFEIVYPENRIVLDYNGMDDLILLGAVENKTGYYIGPNSAKNLFTWRGRGWPKDGSMWPGPVVEVMPFNTISEALGHMARDNAEGYVIRSHNFMVKLKQPDYLELHRLVTNMTPKSIWEQLKTGKTVDQICADLPDEFHQMAKDIAEPLVARYHERVNEILDGFTTSRGRVEVQSDTPNHPRKRYAQEFTKHKDAKYYFLLLDNKSISDVLWMELKPKETVVVRED